MVDAAAGAAAPDSGFDFSKDLKALEGFGIALAELVATGLGTAKLSLSIPKADTSGTVTFVRALKYEAGIDKDGKFFANVSAA